MYGFKPRHAQGKPVQNLADGGIVHSLTGMLGMRKRTPEELRAADAKSQARNQEAATAAAGRAQAAPAPAAQAAPAKAISEYSGMSAMQRREKEQGLADGGTVKPRGFKAGGMIRGPGTGTSDSIETEKKPGTFIMPADSTQAIGPEALEELGEVDDSAVEEQGEKMPVRLSNGEFELPPEQVQALGEAVLTVMRNATHQPAGGQEAPTGKGFTPQQFFASGGVIENDVTRIGNSYSGGNVVGAVSINGQAGSGTMSTVPAPVSPAPAPVAAPATTAATPPTTPATSTTTPAATPAPAAAPAPMGWAERNAQRSNQVTASSILDSPERQSAQAALAPKPELGAPAVQGLQTPAKNPAIAPMPGAPATSSGFKPRQAFSGGGTVKDKEQQRLANQTAMYVRGAQEAAANRPPEPAAPAQPASTSGGLNAPWWSGEYATAARLSDKSGLELEQQRAAAATPGQAPANDPVKRIVNTGTLAIPQAVTKPADAAPAAPAAPNPTDQRLAAGAQQAPTPAQQPSGNSPVGMSVADAQKQGLVGERVGYDPAYDQRLTGAPGQNGAVTRNGNSYAGTNVSGDITVNGQAPGGGAVSAQNMVAADALQARQTPAGFQPAGSQQAGVQAPIVRNSTNDWAARNNLRNASVSASSITNNGGEFDRSGPGDSAAMAEYKAALATDQAMQSAQPGMDQAAMRENAGIQREGMQQQGATTRASMQEAGANARDANRTNLAGQELGMRREAQGFQTRAQAQQEQLRGVLTNPNATPQQRAQAQQALQSLTGKGESWKAVALQGGTDAQGNKTESLLGAVNERTGEMKRMEGQGGAQKSAEPPPRDSLVRGQVYQTKAGSLRWNGSEFERV